MNRNIPGGSRGSEQPGKITLTASRPDGKTATLIRSNLKFYRSFMHADGLVKRFRPSSAQGYCGVGVGRGGGGSLGDCVLSCTAAEMLGL